MNTKIVEISTEMACLIDSHSSIGYEPGIDSYDLQLDDEYIESQIKELRKEIEVYIDSIERDNLNEGSIFLESYRMMDATRIVEEGRSDFWEGMYENATETLLEKGRSSSSMLSGEINLL